MKRYIRHCLYFLIGYVPFGYLAIGNVALGMPVYRWESAIFAVVLAVWMGAALYYEAGWQRCRERIALLRAESHTGGHPPIEAYRVLPPDLEPPEDD